MQDKKALAEAGFQLCQKIRWPHTLAEWDIMAQTGTMLSIDSASESYATAVLTPHTWGMTLGMILVDPSKRRLGLGTAITKLAMGLAEEFQAAALGLTSSPAAETMYTKLGFVQIGSIAVLKKPRSLGCAHPPTETKIISSGQEISDKFYGGCKSYAAILDAVERKASVSLVERHMDGTLAGFVCSMTRVGADGKEFLAIGPVVADSSAVAETLCQRLVVSTSKAMTCFVFDHCDGETGPDRAMRHAILQGFNRNGFVPSDRLKLMSLQGKPIIPYLSSRIVSPVSLALG